IIFINSLLLKPIHSLKLLVDLPAPPVNIGIHDLFCNYIFDITNQASFSRKDYCNDPDRPIPASLINIDQVKIWSMLPCCIFFYIFKFASYVWQWYPQLMRNYFSSIGYFILIWLFQ
ncbi:hypothetical protein CI102_13322, partial [Trichoderma harzianum]